MPETEVRIDNGQRRTVLTLTPLLVLVLGLREISSFVVTRMK
jgi:hypothetical protein